MSSAVSNQIKNPVLPVGGPPAQQLPSVKSSSDSVVSKLMAEGVKEQVGDAPSLQNRVKVIAEELTIEEEPAIIQSYNKIEELGSAFANFCSRRFVSSECLNAFFVHKLFSEVPSKYLEEAFLSLIQNNELEAAKTLEAKPVFKNVSAENLGKKLGKILCRNCWLPLWSLEPTGEINLKLLEMLVANNGNVHGAEKISIDDLAQAVLQCTVYAGKQTEESASKVKEIFASHKEMTAILRAADLLAMKQDKFYNYRMGFFTAFKDWHCSIVSTQLELYQKKVEDSNSSSGEGNPSCVLM